MKTGITASGVRQILDDLLLVLFILLTVDVVVVMLHKINTVVLKTDYQKVFRYQLILCAVLLLFALDVRFNLFTRSQFIVLRVVSWVLRAAVVLFSAVILFFCGKAIEGGMIRNAGEADYAIVLGLALENGQPAPDLLRRLDTAEAYLKEYSEARLILTGGNADGLGRTEAEVMRDTLTEKGIPESRLILEDRAETTEENFRNIAALVSKDAPVVMISSDYHMDRAVRYAKREGFSGVMRLPAPSGIPAYGANMLWEVILDLNDLTKWNRTGD